MNEQEKVFVVGILDKLVAQGGCSVLAGTTHCRYRGDNGRKCAVGHLIPDEKYQPSFECLLPGELPPDTLDCPEEFRYLLDDLQSVHDLASNYAAVELHVPIFQEAKERVLSDMVNWFHVRRFDVIPR